MRDPFEVLGVARDADEETLTKAYRKLARQYHPDTHPDDPVAESRMKEVNAAYEQIKDIRAGRAPDPSRQGTGENPFTGYGTGNPYGTAGGNPYGGYGYSGDPFRYTYRGFYSYGQTGEESGQRRRTYRVYRPRSIFWRLLLLFFAVRIVISVMSCTADFLFSPLRGRNPQPSRQSAADVTDYDPKGDLPL